MKNATNFSTDMLGGLLLIAATILALISANTPLNEIYQLLIQTPVKVSVGNLGIDKPLLLWVNDGLMAVFFFLIGLELKRELVMGELSDRRNILLPLIGAVGGMSIPALIYIMFNHQDPDAFQGWAIPAATDIAFVLGILALLGSRVPVALKVFLTSLAIFDDVGAIVIIAIFYTANISTLALLTVAGCVPILWWLNYKGIASKTAYLVIGLIMWVATLKSGVHATLAGVLLAMFIPITARDGSSPLQIMEHSLHGTVLFFIVPVFAFANAGLVLSDIGCEQILHPVPIGIALGLFIGKQVGIFGLCCLAIKLGWAKLPQGVNWLGLYGASILAGVGFTMSLFIGSLAFEETGTNLLFDERLGILLGSLLSGVFGYAILYVGMKPQSSQSSSNIESSI